jgi:hypothetical protein
VVVLDASTLDVRHVVTRGRWRVRDGDLLGEEGEA